MQDPGGQDSEAEPARNTLELHVCRTATRIQDARKACGVQLTVLGPPTSRAERLALCAGTAYNSRGADARNR